MTSCMYSTQKYTVMTQKYSVQVNKMIVCLPRCLPAQRYMLPRVSTISLPNANVAGRVCLDMVSTFVL